MNMIDLSIDDCSFMDEDEFVALAKKILELNHTTNFKDDWVRIETNYNGLDLQITRRAQLVDDVHPESHLRVSNPVTMVCNGEVIRHHGEHCYLVNHMQELAGII